MSTELRQRVYQVFSPAPLLPQDKDLYIDLDDVRGGVGIVQRMADTIRLSNPNKPTCQIVAGHRGSGKSTELRRLQDELQRPEDRLFAVYCEADDDIDRNDVDFPEVLIAVVRQMAAQLKDQLGISLKPGYFKDRWERLKHLLGSEVNFEKLDLSKGMLKVSGVIKSSPDARLDIRKQLEPDTSNWLTAANDVIGKAKLELAKKGYRDLAIIVDDLDKMVLRPHESGVTTCAHLFVNREAQLTAFKCHMVYTMPIALAYSLDEPKIANLYGAHPPVVPMTKIRTRPPRRRPSKPGIRKLRQLIDTRLVRANATQADVFADDAVRDKLIDASGGQPRELVLLIREAIVGNGLPINDEAVGRAIRHARNAYARQLQAQHWPILQAVRATGRLERNKDNDDAIRDLLDSRAILQYRNEEEWYDVNPTIAMTDAPEASPDQA